MHRTPLLGRQSLRERKRNQMLHLARLKSMKADIDNEPPKVYPHLKSKKKKTAQIEQRLREIEHENLKLLEKMAHIMNRPTGQNSMFGAPIGSTTFVNVRKLNEAARRKRNQKIQRENLQIVQRIHDSSPNYNNQRWKDNWEQQKKLVRNICQLPCVLDLDGHTMRHERRRERRHNRPQSPRRPATHRGIVSHTVDDNDDECESPTRRASASATFRERSDVVSASPTAFEEKDCNVIENVKKGDGGCM